MKLLIFVCILLAAEAAKLQGYQPPRLGSTDVSLAGISGPSPSGQLLNTFTSGASQQGQFQSSSNGLFGAQQQQSFVGSNPQITSQQGFVSGSVSSQPFLNTQVQGTAIHGTGFSGQQLQQNSLGFVSDDSLESCPDGLIRHFDGSCITPEVVRNVFVYNAPKQEPKPTFPPPSIPLPKLEHNIVFIRTQDKGAGPDPIIVPPAQKKHVIYVLNKQEDQEQKVIELPAPEQSTPEVFFVNYADGETPTLPDGIDFETALNSAIHSEGQIIGGSNGFTQSFGQNTIGVPSPQGNGLVSNGNSGLILVGDPNSREDDFFVDNGGNGNFILNSGSPQTIISNGQLSGFNGNVVTNNGQPSGFNGNVVSSNGQLSGFNGNVVTGTSSRPQQLYRAP